LPVTLPETIVRRRCAALIPYARNARTHSDQQVAQIATSIREFGSAAKAARVVRCGHGCGRKTPAHARIRKEECRGTAADASGSSRGRERAAGIDPTRSLAAIDGGYFVPTPIRYVCGATISSALSYWRRASSISAQAASRSVSVACISSCGISGTRSRTFCRPPRLWRRVESLAGRVIREGVAEAAPGG